MEETEIDPRLLIEFAKALNQNGYSFQHAVIKLIHTMPPNKSGWELVAPEYSAQVKGFDTRIDLVCNRLVGRIGSNTMVLLGECKRANPAFSNWLFAKTPLLDRLGSRPQLQIEGYKLNKETQAGESILFSNPSSKDIYHIAVECKTDKNGDMGGQTKGVIEAAATQIMKGLNGLVELYHQKPGLLCNDATNLFLPVIFTTANLFTTDIDISSANIETGDIEAKYLKPVEKNWLIYQYNLSPGIKHSIQANKPANTLEEILTQEYVRSIPIVNSKGIPDFLTWSSSLNPLRF
jgi:hypothetical protein